MAQLFARLSSFVRLYSEKTALRLSDAEKICDETHLVAIFQCSVKMMISQFPFFVRDSVPRSDPKLRNAAERYEKMCYYMGPGRELYPGPIMIDCYRALESPENLTVTNLKTANMLAWALESAATSIIVIDDILDGNVKRWRKPCWHAQPHIGLTALIDSKLFTMGSFAIIRKYLKSHPNYKHFHRILSDLVYLTTVGQALDSETSENFVQTRQLHLLSMERFSAIKKYKTYLLMYGAPPSLQCTLQISIRNFISTHDHFFKHLPPIGKLRLVPSILNNISQIFSQNDMWDAYSEYKTIGKIGTDITGGKCTWLTATALLHANERQKKALQENYGKFETECQKVVYEVFHELDILGRYKQLKEDFMRDCNERTSAVGHSGFTRMVNTLLKKYVAVSEDFQL